MGGGGGQETCGSWARLNEFFWFNLFVWMRNTKTRLPGLVFSSQFFFFMKISQASFTSYLVYANGFTCASNHVPF